jgi:hypothetical protein
VRVDVGNSRDRAGEGSLHPSAEGFDRVDAHLALVQAAYGRRRSLMPKVLVAGLGFGLAGLALLVSGCGGSNSPSVANLGATTTRNSGRGSGPPHAAVGGPAVAFADCIRHHGDPTLPASTPGNPIPVPDPNAPLFVEAERKCAAIMPQNAPPEPRRENTGPLLAFVACMRKHGLPDVPDPNHKGVFPNGALNGLDAGSPQFQSAAKTCQPLLRGEAVWGFPRVSPDGRVSIAGP